MNQEQVEAEVTRVVASIKLPVALSAFDLRAFYHKVWQLAVLVLLCRVLSDAGARAGQLGFFRFCAFPPFFFSWLRFSP